VDLVCGGFDHRPLVVVQVPDEGDHGGVLGANGVGVAGGQGLTETVERVPSGGGAEQALRWPLRSSEPGPPRCRRLVDAGVDDRDFASLLLQQADDAGLVLTPDTDPVADGLGA
jgi:hypothetical protein